MIVEYKPSVESEAMREVRELKRLCDDEVADLPAAEAVRRSMELAGERSRRMIARMNELKAAGVRIEFKAAGG